MTGPPQDLVVVPADPWLDRFRVTLVSVLGAVVAGIACLAFYTSFEAIKAFAMRSDGISPEHAWAVPLLVDSFIVVATAADLWFVITRRDRAWWEMLWPKVLLATAAAVSFALNIAHADPTLAARGVAAIPPAALVLGVELLMMVLRRATGMRAARAQLVYQAAYAEGLTRPPTTIDSLTRFRPTELPAPIAADDFRRNQPAVPELPPVSPAQTAASSMADGPGTRVSASTDRQAPLPAAVPTTPDLESGLPRPNAGQAVARRTAYRILFERAPGQVRTPEELKMALAGEGVTVDQATAGRLLREVSAPVKGKPGDAKAAGELLTALTNHGITVNLRTARRLLREFDTPGQGKPGEARTPEELQAALVPHGITIDLDTAASLLRGFDLPRGPRPSSSADGGRTVASVGSSKVASRDAVHGVVRGQSTGQPD